MEITFKVAEFSEKFSDIFGKLCQLESMSIKSGIMKLFSAFNRILNITNSLNCDEMGKTTNVIILIIFTERVDWQSG